MRREVKYRRLLTLLTFAKRNAKKSRVKYTVADYPGCRRKINGKQRKSVANVVADLARA